MDQQVPKEAICLPEQPEEPMNTLSCSYCFMPGKLDNSGALLGQQASKSDRVAVAASGAVLAG